MRAASVSSLVAAALLLGGAMARACPCQGSAGSGAAVTNSSQTYGVAATTTGRYVHGAWGTDGHYSALSSGTRQWMLDLGVSAGYRPWSRLEIGGEAAFGYQVAETSTFSSRRNVFGDTSLRLRWEAIDEPMPYESELMPPSVAFVAGVRIPTGYVGRQASGSASGTTGAIGSAAASQGLGAWEPNVSVDVARTIERRFRIALMGQAAYRFSDTRLGFDRQLGPRAMGQLNLRWIPSVKWGLGLINEIGWEGPVSIDGSTRKDTAQRMWAVDVYGYYILADAGLRLGLMARYVPPVDAISVNAVSASSLALSVGYAH